MDDNNESRSSEGCESCESCERCQERLKIVNFMYGTLEEQHCPYARVLPRGML